MPTEVTLYRHGNANSPRLAYVRDQDITMYDFNGELWVEAPPLKQPKGISTFHFDQRPSGKNWWKLEADAVVPDDLVVLEDPTIKNHWLWAPTHDMPLNYYEQLLKEAETNQSWVKLSPQPLLFAFPLTPSAHPTVAKLSEEKKLVTYSPKVHKLLSDALNREISHYQSYLGHANLDENEEADLVNDLALLELIRSQHFLKTNSPPFMSQAKALGQGFNIYGALTIDSLIRPIFDFRKVDTTSFTFLGAEYQIPSIVNGITNSRTYYVGGTAETRDEFQNTLAAHTKVDASYGAFSGEIEAAFSREYQQSSLYLFSFKNFYSQLAYLQLIPDTQYLSDDFQERIHQLPGSVTEDNFHIFEDFFNTFGIYFTSKVVLGASLSFYVATSKASNLKKQEITASLNAEYNGLFATGSISGDIKHSDEWKRYTENSRVEISALGADPTKGAKLGNVSDAERFNPTSKTVDAFNDWLESIQSYPAIVDFALTGIWEVCGNKRKAVQEAWDIYGQRMHPKAVINTSSNHQGSVSVPTITIGRQIKPDKPPTNPDHGGYQVVVFDGDITKQDSIILNRYYTPASNAVQEINGMYEEIYNDLSEFAKSGSILIFVSYQWYVAWPPRQNIVGLLRSAGAGEKLTDWLNTREFFDDSLNYILVGIFDQGTNTGVEVRETDADQIQTELNVLFYRRTDGSGYTLGESEVSETLEISKS